MNLFSQDGIIAGLAALLTGLFGIYFKSRRADNEDRKVAVSEKEADVKHQKMLQEDIKQQRGWILELQKTVSNQAEKISVLENEVLRLNQENKMLEDSLSKNAKDYHDKVGQLNDQIKYLYDLAKASPEFDPNKIFEILRLDTVHNFLEI